MPEDLDRHACLFHRWSATGKLHRWAFSRGDSEIDYEPPVSAVASSVEPLIDLAEHGVGLICTPAFTVRRQLADGRLVRVLAPFVQAAGTVQALWPGKRHQSPKVKAFVNFTARHLGIDVDVG